MSTESVMPSNHLILCHPLLLLPSIFPSIRVFSNESALHIRWPKYWSFSFTISPSNEYSGLISFRIVTSSQFEGKSFSYYTTTLILPLHAPLTAQLLRNPPAMQETWVRSLCWEDSLEKGKATHSSILVWRIPWTIHGVAKSQTQLSDFHFSLSKLPCGIYDRLQHENHNIDPTFWNNGMAISSIEN